MYHTDKSICETRLYNSWKMLPTIQVIFLLVSVLRRSWVLKIF